jgi:site-specific recombinase XerC
MGPPPSRRASETNAAGCGGFRKHHASPVPHLPLHATHPLERGRDIHTIQKLMGYKDIQTTAIDTLLSAARRTYMGQYAGQYELS